MQRKPMIGDQSNPYIIRKLPLDKTFWQHKSLSEIWTLLKGALIGKPATLALPTHEDLQALLKMIAQRVVDALDETIISSLFKFVDPDNDIRFLENDQGEEYLQVMGTLLFYNGQYQDATRMLEVLGNVYFLSDRVETNWLSAYYNHMAALAFREVGDVDKACQHYNQFLYQSGCHTHTPEDVSAAMAYLLENRALVTTDRLLRELLRVIEKCSDESDLKSKLKRQHSRAEEQVIFEDLDRRKIKENLQAVIPQLKETRSIICSPIQQAVTQVPETLFAGREKGLDEPKTPHNTLRHT